MTSPVTDAPAAHRISAARMLVLVLVSALAVIAVRAFLVQSFVVPSASMAPTVEPGDRVLVSRLAAGEARRGEVIVFDGSGVFVAEPAAPLTPLAAIGGTLAAAIGMPVGRSDYVKRVVGLPGERVTCCDPQGRITIDGTPLAEPYLAPGEAASRTPFDVEVPPGRLWVMGDHRSDSADSRAHLGDPGGGTVPLDHVVGRVVAVWWPLDRSGEVPGAAQEARG